MAGRGVENMTGGRRKLQDSGVWGRRISLRVVRVVIYSAEAYRGLRGRSGWRYIHRPLRTSFSDYRV